MSDKLEIYIDDTPMDLSNDPEMTDEEYEQLRAEAREYVAKEKEKKTN